MMKAENAPPPRPTEPVRPQQQQVHTTTTTTTTTSSPAVTLDWIKFDFNYYRTIPGILKLAEFIFGIFCMGFAAPARFAGTHFFLFVVVFTFLITSLWICVYFLSIREALTLKIPWIALEFYYTLGSTIFYFIAMIVQFAVASGFDNSGVAAAVFGLFNTIVYGAGTFFLFKDWKQSTQPNNPPNP